MCVNWDNDENISWTCSLEPVINPDIVEGEKHYKTNCIEGRGCAGSFPAPAPSYDPSPSL